MRKFLMAIVLLFLLPFGDVNAKALPIPVKEQPAVEIQADSLDMGIITASFKSKSSKKAKLGITKNDTTYYYDLLTNGEAGKFPLQMQNGTYTITVFEQTSGNNYKAVLTKKVTLQLKDTSAVYLQSVQNLKWDSSMEPIKTAAKLVNGKIKTEDKVKEIHSFVTRNIKYDFEKYRTVKTGYLPDINSTFSDKKGICYDYASLFGSMLRSQGIPAKLVTGYSNLAKGYHAWNEVYIKELKKWVIIDTTVDASIKNYSGKPIYKKSSDYKKQYEY